MAYWWNNQMNIRSKQLGANATEGIRQRSCGSRNTQRGSSLVEMGFILSFLLLLAIGVIDFGRAFYDSIELENAARAGAEYGATAPTDTAGMIAAAKSDASTDISTVAATASYGCMCSDGSNSSASCTTTPSCSSSTRQVNYVQVNTSYTYTTFLPWPGIPSSFALTGNATLSPGE